MKGQFGIWQGLLGATIDYAGTFPPAALPLDDALREAATFRRKGTHPWIFSKVVLPLSVIRELKTSDLVAAGANGEPWQYAGLASAVGADSDYQRTTEWDLREIVRCNERGAEAPIRQTIVSYETRPPEDFWVGAEEGALSRSLSPLLSSFEERLGRGFGFFLEVPWGPDWNTHVELAAGAVSRWMADSNGSLAVGLKFRAGGKVVPSPEDLARSVSVCTRYGLRYKATQGLHHAVTGDGYFGFLNLWAALSFSRILGDEQFPVETLTKILLESNPEAFRGKGNTLTWEGHTVELSQVEMARRSHGATFGSCSLDEPDEELKTLVKETN